MNNLEILEASSAFESRPALEILQWAAARFAPRLTFATGFGAEGLVLIDLIGRHELPIDLFTLDTGVLFPETYDLWRRLEARYGIKIRAVPPHEAIDELWKTDPDRCCELRKVIPLKRAVAGFDAWITAVRRDQTADRAAAGIIERDAKFGLVKINPLATWTSDQVWTHLREHAVPYNPLHDRGYPSIGCQPCTSPVAPGENPRAGRWRGREKTECGLHSKRTLVTERN